MVHKDYGRIDYKTRLKKWRAIFYAGYLGNRELSLGDFGTRDEAVKVLQDKIKVKN